MEVKGIPLEEREELVKKYYRYMDRYMRQSMYGVVKSRWPVLKIELSGGTYTNVRPEEGKMNYIHLDVGPRVCIDDETDFVNTCEVFIGHEVQHIRSTTDKGWIYGLNGGKLAICQEHQKSTGKRTPILRTPQDCDRYIKSLADSGYKISKNSIEEFVHFIMNSVEDGRIERIRCNQRPGFKKKLAAYRGKEWLGAEMEELDEKALKVPNVYVPVILNQVLNLSTMSIYQKGFTKTCMVDSRPMEVVQILTPYIAKGVSADSCRKGMQQAIEICRILALDILEASRMTPLEELLEKLAQFFSNMASYSADSSNEEMDGNAGESLFGNSCLIVELEDEEFDRLEKEAKEKGMDSSNARVIFKRKHPRKDQEKGNEKSLDGSGDGSERENGSKSDNPSFNEGKPSGESKTQAQDKNKGSADGSPSGNSGGDNARAEAAVRDTIQNALLELEQDAENAEQIVAADKASEPTNTVIRMKEDPLMNLSSINQAYDDAEKVDFRETERCYKPNQRMPMDLLGKANTLKRRLIQIMKNMEEPEVRERKSGVLDPAAVYKLALGNLDCFVKNGISSEFDGCVEILMDRSGSMGGGTGSKFQACCEALAVMEYAFTDIAPMKIVAFDTNGRKNVLHEIIKSWHEKLPFTGAYNFMLNSRGRGGNKDGFSIRAASAELLAQPYRKKILIVLSDGLPSDYNGGYAAGIADVLSAVQSARKSGIEVISIFFGDGEDSENFREMYGRRNCIVTEPDMIGDRLYEILKSCVTND